MTTLTLTRPYPPVASEVRAALAARERLLPFCQWVNPRFELAPHLEAAARELEAVERGDNDRLMILMPPRHGKSELVSRRFPPWLMGRDPSCRIQALALRAPTTISA
ncbi:MAG: hypothetical protein WD904_14350 [Dehalococcoidia bacterium]